MTRTSVKNLRIKGLWGRLNVDIPLSPEVNILHGINGSGKTAVINLLNAILTCDLRNLRSTVFKRATVAFVRRDAPRTIAVTRSPSESEESANITYRFGSDKTHSVVSGDVPDYLSFGHAMRKFGTRGGVSAERPTISEASVTKHLHSLLPPVRWLSVHRGTVSPRSRRRPEEQLTAVQAKVKDLLSQFRDYQLSLESRESEVATAFQNEVTETMLYDPQLDDYNPSTIRNFDAEQEEQRLLTAFLELGFEQKEIKPHIKNHLSRLQEVVRKIQERDPKQPGSFTFEDVSALSLLGRTTHIVQLATNLQEQKRGIFEQRDKFLQSCNEFLKDKELYLGESGELLCKLRRATHQKVKNVPLERLSSGEKQLLILLIETLVQDNSPCLFITDEPELSLHVEWQEKLLATIRSLNPNCQIIVATHSPDIVGPYDDYKISMAEVTSERS